MEYRKETALIEAILLLETEPVDAKKISTIAGVTPEEAAAAVAELRDSWASEGRGIEIVEIGGGWALSPRRDLWESLKERYGKSGENRLSRAAMETLAIIAYSQPITRAEIEAIRGVSADGMMRLLIQKQFIREVGKKEVPGKPVQYGTTREFLKIFRLSTIADLPKLDGLDRMKFEQEPEGDQDGKEPEK
jgi:segregation and condensation protein B